jgi:uncharacterized phage-associated protein
MKFLYHPRKAAQAAAFLVSKKGGQMSVFALIKILYLSDRKVLSLRGRPITGDAMVSMPHGPVLSRIYDSIKSGADENQSQTWHEYLTERDNHNVSLRVQDPPTDELSQFERDILADTLSQYGHFTFAELRDITHRLPEYVDPQGSSLQIDPVKILMEEGWSKEEIQEAIMSAREEKVLREVCA